MGRYGGYYGCCPYGYNRYNDYYNNNNRCCDNLDSSNRFDRNALLNKAHDTVCKDQEVYYARNNVYKDRSCKTLADCTSACCDNHRNSYNDNYNNCGRCNDNQYGGYGGCGYGGCGYGGYGGYGKGYGGCGYDGYGKGYGGYGGYGKGYGGYGGYGKGYGGCGYGGPCGKLYKGLGYNLGKRSGAYGY